MKFKAIIATAAATLLVAALPVLAHHSFTAEYDNTKPLTLKGKFVHMDWVNPHSWVHIEVTDADGKVTLWKAETPPPNGLYRNGWRKDSLKEGEPIEITGVAAKDGSAHMWANSVTLLNSGAKLGFGTRPPNEDPNYKAK